MISHYRNRSYCGLDPCVIQHNALSCTMIVLLWCFFWCLQAICFDSIALLCFPCEIVVSCCAYRIVMLCRGNRGQWLVASYQEQLCVKRRQWYNKIKYRTWMLIGCESCGVLLNGYCPSVSWRCGAVIPRLVTRYTSIITHLYMLQTFCHGIWFCGEIKGSARILKIELVRFNAHLVNKKQ